MTALRDLLRLRAGRSDLLIGVTAAVVGFAMVVQVSSRAGAEDFPAAREEDLVRILDDLSNREERLRGQIGELQRTRDRLTGGLDAGAEALAEARRRAQVLGILAGTLPARGPGVVLTVRDPEHLIRAEVLLDAVQELRDAGAEAMMVNGVRLVAASYVLDDGPRIVVDGTGVSAPFVFTAIGDAATLAEAMDIPGGLADVVAANAGAELVVERRTNVVVDALRPLKPPEYARPSPSPGG